MNKIFFRTSKSLQCFTISEFWNIFCITCLKSFIFLSNR